MMSCPVVPAHAIPEFEVRPIEQRSIEGASDADLDTFLDRLMQVESGGRDRAANPRSTALGPFQFIKSTFIDLVQRNFPAETNELNVDEVLELRVNRPFARRAAELYCEENFATLSQYGFLPTFGHLRLAFLVGPTAAVRLIRAQPETPAEDILGAAVIKANPFMGRMSASDLIARAERDVSDDRHRPLGKAPPARARPVAESRPAVRASPRASDVWRAVNEPRSTVNAKCNRNLASCRRWITLREARVRDDADRKRQTKRAGRRPAPGS
jgi:hypothetical protein